MKTEILDQVKELDREGYDVEEIMENTGLSKASAYRYLKAIREEESSGEGPLSGIEKANELKERELDALEKKQFIETEKSKRKALKEFKPLVEGILDHVQGSAWDSDAISKVSKEIDELSDQIEEIFGFDKEAMRDNSIYEILSILKSEFQGLSKRDPDYTIKIDWADEKIGMLNYGLGIESFDDDEFDTEEYQRQKAFGVYDRFITSLLELENKKIDMDHLEELESELEFVRESISRKIPGVEEEFEHEIDVLKELESLFSEFEIRIEESFWGEKRFIIPEEIHGMIEFEDNENVENQE